MLTCAIKHREMAYKKWNECESWKCAICNIKKVTNTKESMVYIGRKWDTQRQKAANNETSNQLQNCINVQLPKSTREKNHSQPLAVNNSSIHVKYKWTHTT